MKRKIELSLKRLTIMNRYYKITKFYSFIKSTAYNGLMVGAVILAILFVLEYFFLDFDALLNHFVATYSAAVIIPFFYASETILGLVPPEIFIAWASKTANPWLFLLVLATMSYVGGITAYFVGNRLSMIRSIKQYLEEKVAKHITNLRKWGGLFVIIGAMLPIPHSVVSLACGLIRYNFKSYLLWALFRYVRFVVYALVIFQIF